MAETVGLTAWGLGEVAPTVVVLLVLVSFLAGWIDAVVGGGGLIQLPALLLVPGLSPVQALATNKLASIPGTLTSSVTYYRRVHPDLRTALPMAVIAMLGGFAGGAMAALLPAEVIEPVILVILVGVLLYTILRPRLGAETMLRHSGRRHHGVAAAIGAVIGFYDGLIGPGTGSFLVIALVSLLGYGFLEASAKAKIVNSATNIGALLFFIPNGSVVWGLGLLMGTANVMGAYTGARMAVARGSGFVRIVFLVVVGALILRLGWDVLLAD